MFRPYIELLRGKKGINYNNQWRERKDIISRGRYGILHLSLPSISTGQVTNRCHKREFLLNFAKDRRRWLQWLFCGYNEIQRPKRKDVLIDYEKLRELLGFDGYESVTSYHKKWVDEYLGSENNIRHEKWTRSIALGSKGFAEKVKSIMGVLAIGRKSIGAGESYQLRGPSIP